MAEYVDSFEINTVEAEETTNETFPLLPRVNTYDNNQIDTSEIHETSFGGSGKSLESETLKENLEKEINAVQRHFRVDFTDEQRKKFKLDEKGRLYYETENKGPVYITREKGEIYSGPTLEKRLGSKIARNLLGIERYRAKKAVIFNEIDNIASEYDGSTTLTELEEMQDRLDNRVEA